MQVGEAGCDTCPPCGNYKMQQLASAFLTTLFTNLDMEIYPPEGREGESEWLLGGGEGAVGFGNKCGMGRG